MHIFAAQNIVADGATNPVVEPLATGDAVGSKRTGPWSTRALHEAYLSQGLRLFDCWDGLLDNRWFSDSQRYLLFSLGFYQL